MTLAKRIRGLFKEDRSPKTNKAIAIDLGVRENSVRTTMLNMPDAHILCWDDSTNRATMVWMVVHVPDHAPRPAPKTKGKTR